MSVIPPSSPSPWQPRPPAPIPLPRLALVFLTLGATAFGGLAMAEPIRRRVVDREGWVSLREFLDGLAFCQLLPGAIMVSFVTYLGQRLRRTPGAVISAVCFILPAFLLMLGLSYLYFRYRSLAFVQALSRGLGTLVLALLLQAAWHLGRRIGRHGLDVALMGLAAAAFWAKLPFTLVFLAAGAARLGLARWFPLPRTAEPADAAAPPLSWRRLALQTALLALGVTAALLALSWQQPPLARLAAICLKIGALSFGGGLVMIPALQWEVVDHLGWLTLPQFLDGILLGFLTPGPIIILSTFVGFALQGPVGALVATAAAFFPAIALVLLLSPFYHRLKQTPAVRPVIQGILAALIAMLAVVLVQMGSSALHDWRDLVLFLASAGALLGLRLNLLWVAPAVAAVSLWWF